MVGYTLLILYLEFLLYIGCVERKPGPTQNLNIKIYYTYNKQLVLLEHETHVIQSDDIISKNSRNTSLIIKQSKEILFNSQSVILNHVNVNACYDYDSFDWDVTFIIASYANSTNRRKICKTNQLLLNKLKSNYLNQVDLHRHKVNRNRKRKNSVNIIPIKHYSKQIKNEYLKKHASTVYNTMNKCIFSDCWKRAHTVNTININKKIQKKHIIKLFSKCANNSIYRNNCIYNLFNNNISCDPNEMKYHIGGSRVCKYCWCDAHHITYQTLHNKRLFPPYFFFVLCFVFFFICGFYFYDIQRLSSITKFH